MSDLIAEIWTKIGLNEILVIAGLACLFFISKASSAVFGGSKKKKKKEEVSDSEETVKKN
jgi:hypothetical protein